ncbi:MAG TPA: hypothetical protein VLO11_08550 [Luteolibacter sp.]|nr:hypothetical protein [Luteolibacter sp.]
MTEKPSTQDMASNSSDSAPDGGFFKLFATGVVGWLLGMAALFGAAWIFEKPETLPIALLWMVSHSWIAFLLGLVLMVVRGATSRAALARPALAYVLPVAVLVAVALACLAVYPDVSLRGDFMTYLPVVLVFYGFGCLWLAVLGKRADGGAFLRAVIPSLVGGLIILGFVAVPAFASDAFRYRSAFKLTTDEKKIQDGTLVFSGTLEITKPGNYAFVAPRYVWAFEEEDSEADTAIEYGAIEWGEPGAPENGALGTFPLRIVWSKGVVDTGVAPLPPYEESVLLEVRDQNEGDRLIYTIYTEEEVN